MPKLVNRDIKRSFFDLSHLKNMTCKMGKVYPFLHLPVLPADSFKFSAEMLLRFTPLVAPVMTQVTARMHWFFVPNRLIWTDWEDWITQSLAGGSSAVFPTVTIPAGGYDVGSLADYLDIPTGVAAGQTISAFKFRGIAQLWNDWYRPAQKSGTTSLVAPKTIDKTDGADTTTTGIGKSDLPFQSAWENDMFTSLLLTPSAKATSITIPLGSTAPVNYVPGGTTAGIMRKMTDDSVAGDGAINQSSGVTSVAAVGLTFYDPNGTLVSDLASATGISINDLRWYSSLQRFFERLIKGTPRYTSFISTFFGVESSDQRLQRAELIGASKVDVIISEVLSTNGASGGDFAEMAGHGIAALQADTFEWSSEEHGQIYGCLTIRPRTQYFEGLCREDIKDSADDFGIPEFALIGEQAHYLSEVYAAGTNARTTVFGYGNRYGEYKAVPNKVNGLLRSTFNYWAFIRDFSSDPSLNEAFVMCTPSVLPFVEQTADNMVIQIANHVHAVRPLPAMDEEYRLL